MEDSAGYVSILISVIILCRLKEKMTEMRDDDSVNASDRSFLGCLLSVPDLLCEFH